MYKNKYLKYKNKYNNLLGGAEAIPKPIDDVPEVNIDLEIEKCKVNKCIYC
jgi:hypothetical protein